MKVRKDVCIFCRHTFNFPSIKPPARSAFTTKQEPYVLPRLVIDLDATDSKFVTKLEEQEESDSKRTRDGTHKTRRVVPKRQHTGEPTDRLDIAKRKPKPPLNTQTVGPEDLLRYALLGDPSLSPTRDNEGLRRIFKAKSILPLHFAGEKTLQLGSHFSLDPIKNLERAGFNPQWDQFLRQKLRMASHFTSYERLITMIATTTDGCKFLASAGPDIAEGIRQSRIARNNAPVPLRANFSIWMVVDLLNNLRLNMMSKGVQFPGSLGNAGLYYAAKMGLTSTAQTYLDEILTNSHPVSWHSIRALRCFQRYLSRRESHKRLWAAWLKPSERRDLSLGLITGFDSPTRNIRLTHRGACFADLLDLTHEESSTSSNSSGIVNSGIYCAYVSGLGELGLTDVLWSEWIASGGPDLSVGRLSDHPVAELFMVAFLIARDRPRALSVLESSLGKHKATNLVEPIGSAATLSKRASTFRQLLASKRQPTPFLQELLTQHYRYHELLPGSSLRTVLEQLIPSQAPIDALAEIERLVLTGYRSVSYRNQKISGKLHWREYRGSFGLLVFGEADKAPAYFKGDGNVPIGYRSNSVHGVDNGNGSGGRNQDDEEEHKS